MIFFCFRISLVSTSLRSSFIDCDLSRVHNRRSRFTVCVGSLQFVDHVRPLSVFLSIDLVSRFRLSFLNPFFWLSCLRVLILHFHRMFVRSIRLWSSPSFIYSNRMCLSPRLWVHVGCLLIVFAQSVCLSRKSTLDFSSFINALFSWLHLRFLRRLQKNYMIPITYTSIGMLNQSLGHTSFKDLWLMMWFLHVS